MHRLCGLLFHNLEASTLLGVVQQWALVVVRSPIGHWCHYPRPEQYSRMSFSSDQVTGKVFSSEHAFPSKFLIYLEHCPRGEAVITGHLRFSSMK